MCWMPTSPLSPRRDGSRASASSRRPASSTIDYTELLQHFDKVQSKHLEVRHQRAGRAEQPERRVVL